MVFSVLTRSCELLLLFRLPEENKKRWAGENPDPPCVIFMLLENCFSYIPVKAVVRPLIMPAGPFEAMAPIKQATAHNPTMPEKALITTMLVLEAVSIDEDFA